MTYTPTHPYTHGCRHVILHWAQKRVCCLSAQQEKRKMTFFHSNSFSDGCEVDRSWSCTSDLMLSHILTHCVYTEQLSGSLISSPWKFMKAQVSFLMQLLEICCTFIVNVHLIMCNYMHIAIFARKRNNWKTAIPNNCHKYLFSIILKFSKCKNVKYWLYSI